MKGCPARKAARRSEKARRMGVRAGLPRRALAVVLRPIRPGGGGEPASIGLGETRLAPEARLPRLWRDDEVKNDGLDPPLEVEEEEVPHEIETRRERREEALERGVERVLLHEGIARRVVAKRPRHPLGHPLGPPRLAVDRHQARVEIGRVERHAERAARRLELPRQRVALEVHEKDHVIGGRERAPAEVEIREARETGAHGQHVGIDGHDPLELGRQDLVEEQPAENRAGEAALGRQLPVVNREVEGLERDALAQSPRQLLVAGRHVLGLANQHDCMGKIGLGIEHRGDGANRRRKETAVRRQAIGGAHVSGFPPGSEPSPLAGIDLGRDRADAPAGARGASRHATCMRGWGGLD